MWWMRVVVSSTCFFFWFQFWKRETIFNCGLPLFAFFCLYKCTSFLLGCISFCETVLSKNYCSLHVRSARRPMPSADKAREKNRKNAECHRLLLHRRTNRQRATHSTIHCSVSLRLAIFAHIARTSIAIAIALTHALLSTITCITMEENGNINIYIQYITTKCSENFKCKGIHFPKSHHKKTNADWMEGLTTRPNKTTYWVRTFAQYVCVCDAHKSSIEMCKLDSDTILAGYASNTWSSAHAISSHQTIHQQQQQNREKTHSFSLRVLFFFVCLLLHWRKYSFERKTLQVSSMYNKKRNNHTHNIHNNNEQQKKKLSQYIHN